MGEYICIWTDQDGENHVTRCEVDEDGMVVGLPGSLIAIIEIEEEGLTFWKAVGSDEIGVENQFRR